MQSTKGKKLIVIGGFIFRKDNVNKNKSYWVCNHFLPCKVRIHVLEDTDPPEVIRAVGEHTHDEDERMVNSITVVNK